MSLLTSSCESEWYKKMHLEDVEIIDVMEDIIVFTTSSDIKITVSGSKDNVISLFVNDVEVPSSWTRDVYIIAENTSELKLYTNIYNYSVENFYKFWLHSLMSTKEIISIKNPVKITMKCHLMIVNNDVEYHLRGRDFDYDFEFVPMYKTIIHIPAKNSGC